MHGKALFILVLCFASVWADQDTNAGVISVESGSALPAACENSSSSSCQGQTGPEASALQSDASTAGVESRSHLPVSKPVAAEVLSQLPVQDEQVLPLTAGTAAPLEGSSSTQLPPGDGSLAVAPQGAAVATDEQSVAAAAAEERSAQPAAEPATPPLPAAQPPPPTEPEPLLEEELRNFALIKDGELGRRSSTRQMRQAGCSVL